MSTERIEKLDEMMGKQIGVKHYRKIVKFINTTGLKSEILNMMFDTERAQVTGVTSWAALRLEADLSLDKLKELKLKYGEDVTTAVLVEFPDLAQEKGTEKRQATQGDQLKDLIEIVLDIFGDDTKYDSFVELISDIYEVEAEFVETMSFDELTAIMKDLTSNPSFMQS